MELEGHQHCSWGWTTAGDSPEKVFVIVTQLWWGGEYGKYSQNGSTHGAFGFLRLLYALLMYRKTPEMDELDRVLYLNNQFYYHPIIIKKIVACRS